MLKNYKDQRLLQLDWERADDKALGIKQLRIADKLQYLEKDTAGETWDNTLKANLMYPIPLQSLLISNLLSTSNLTKGKNLVFKLQS
jgi:hypothetical protein